MIVGGAYQGKLRYALSLPGAPAPVRESWADGGEDPYEAALSRPVVYRLHLYVRRLLAEGMEIGPWLNRLIRENPSAVLVMDEVGSGIVPVEAKERRYREEAGRAGQLAAAASSEVYRVICGVAVRIK